MKTNKILLGGITGGVTFFLLWWVIYGILLKDFTAANYNQYAMRPMEEMVWWAMIVSNLAYGFLISFVLGWSNTKDLIAGAKVAGIIGLLYSFTVDLGMYFISSMFSNIAALLIDIIVYTVISVVIGGVVAAIMGMGKK